MEATSISKIGPKAGATAVVKGWLYNKRSSGKIQFLIVRDGTGYIQVVVPKADVPAEVWEAAEKATQECSLEVEGTVREEKRAPGGYEMSASRVVDARRLARVPDLAQGARRRLPDEPAAPLDALLAAARGPARALGDGAGDRRLLLRARVRPHRLADPDGLLGRGDLDALRDRLLRRQGVPLAVRAALPRARGRGLRQGLLLRPDVPGGEVEDAPAPDRILDGRAGGRVPRVRGTLRARRGLHRLSRRPRARALRART